MRCSICEDTHKGECPKTVGLFPSRHKTFGCLPLPLDALEEPQAPEIGAKHDEGKARYDLLPWGALAPVVRVLGFGARKYAPDGWRHVQGARARYFAASLRHVLAWWGGEHADPESGEPHLAHAVCCMLFLLALEQEEKL